MAETVYGTHEEGHVMSEKVQTLASTVYKEFEKMIKKYDEDVVKELMPLVVGILESLDISYIEKQEIEVELELIRDDNEQLLTQYEREKQLRKASEQKYLEMEDAIEDDKKNMEDKVESMESIIRMLELKARNAADHVTRLEEKESEMKKEYNKLHERYTELFKTHMDYMERTKILMGTDKLAEITGNSPRIKGFQLPNLRPVSVVLNAGETPNRSESSPVTFEVTSPSSGRDSNISIKNEMGDMESRDSNRLNSTGESRGTSDKLQMTDIISVTDGSTTTTTKKASTDPAPSPSIPKNSTLIDDTVDLFSHNNTQTDKNNKVSVVDSVKTNTKNTVEIPSANNKEQEADAAFFARLHSMESDGYEEDPFNTGLSDTLASIVATTPELDENSEYNSPSLNDTASSRNSHMKKTIYDELAISSGDMIAEVDFGADITGREVNPGDYASSDEDDRDDKGSTVSDNFFGMGKELENLILENTELLATKNALNIVKDDLIAKVDELNSEQEILREEITSLQAVKCKLQLRISGLEEELKKTKEELEKKNQPTSTEEEGDVPMAQRKRFTRVEMARVLMERNQYKERLMELQEAVRWTEMIRASREHPELTTKKKSSIWNFFSNLFSTTNKPKRPIAIATVKYNAPTTQVQPVGDPNKKSREKLGQKSKAYEFLQEEAISEKAKKEREKERREQYKAVRAHVKKDDGRMQAYGWSLPAKFSPSPRETTSKNHIPVPVPVYCRPLTDQDSEVKIWCSAGVNLTGGKTRDGGSIVGSSSIFYSYSIEECKTPTDSKDEVEKLDQELQNHKDNMKDEEQLSSFVWICTSTHSTSHISVIDGNNPADVLETFRVSSSHILCIASVPGALISDYPVAEEILKAEAPLLAKETVISSGNKESGETSGGENSGIGSITFVQCSTGASSQGNSRETSPVGSPQSGLKIETKADIESGAENLVDGAEKDADSTEKSDDSEKEHLDPLGVTVEDDQPTVFRATGSPPSSRNSSPTSPMPPGKRNFHDTGESKDGDSGISSDDIQYNDVEKMSSVLPTMWLGSQTGSLYVHSSVAQWGRCLHSIKLRDSILSIVHVKGRVMVALADGTVAIFHRSSDGHWDLQNYHLLDLGRPHHSIRCMTVIANKHVWCGYKNRIHIISPEDMSIEKTFDAHPRKESQVRQLAWVGDGVWVSIRLDSTLRLYHAYTHQHLQDVDIEPYVSKMLGTGRLGFSFVRITAVLISSNRLWIGTGNGVIVSVPLSENNKQQITTSAAGRPGGVVRVYNDTKTDSITPSSFIPYCSMAQAQLSFHGHKDAVKFFVAVPENEQVVLRHINKGTERKGMSAASDEKQDTSAKVSHEASPAPPTRTKLVLSGGEGYVDFRMGDGGEDEIPDSEMEEKKASLTGKYDRSHLIVWQITSPE